MAVAGVESTVEFGWLVSGDEEVEDSVVLWFASDVGWGISWLGSGLWLPARVGVGRLAGVVESC